MKPHESRSKEDTSRGNSTVLYLDKEGGWGGSSRSLFLLIAHLDRTVFRPLVVSREEGPIQERYASIDVETRIEPIPILKAGQRKNLLVFILFVLKFPRWLTAVRRLGNLIETNQVALIHLNHDGFFPLAIWNRVFWRRPIVCHIRTMIPQNRFGRWQVRSLVKHCDKFICISPRERDRFLHLAGDVKDLEDRVEVIYNIGEAPELERSEVAVASPSEWAGKFRVIWLGNVSHGKGTDRVLDVASTLRARGRTDISFLVCGEERTPATPPLMERLAATIIRDDLADTVRLMGFVESPTGLLREAHAVLRSSRSNDPWGRDIIEGLVQGKPVLATGASSPFVEHGVHGYLFPEYSSAAVADALEQLADNPQLYDEISRRNRQHASRLFSGSSVAPRVADLYAKLLGGRS